MTITQEDALVTKRMEKARRYLRLFMRDTPQLNRLIRKEESDNELFDFAIEMCISDWNTSPPLIGSVSIANFPSLFLLMHGAAIQILSTQGLLQARNQLQYNAGGSSFMRSDKTNIYFQWMTAFDNKYQLQKRNIKIHQNIENGWGGVVSEYDRLGYSW